METWPKLDLEPLKENNMCFGCGETNPIGLKLKFVWDGVTAHAKFTAGKNHQGWSGYMHGGIIACILDEAMGWVAMYAGYNNVTAKMQTRYRKMAPINTPLIVSCTITKKTTRLIETEARLTSEDGAVLAEATSTQFIISPRKEKPEIMKTSEIRAVLWDMDGVIADTSTQHYVSWQFAFNKKGIKFTEEDFKHHFGQRNDTIIKDAAGKEIPQKEIEAIAKDKEDFFREKAKGHTIVFPGVTNLLRVLETNHIVSAIASSAPLENLQVVLRELNIENCFKAMVYGLEVTEGKPSPQVFLLAAKKLGAEPKNCIVIEDAVAGVSAAKKAGMHCIAVTNTHPTQSLITADMIVNTLQLVGIDDLNKLFSKGS